MIKKIVFLLIIISLTVLFPSYPAFAAEKDPGDACVPNVDTCKPDKQGLNYSCLPAKAPPPAFLCQTDVFGKIQAPPPLAGFLKADPTGAGAISQFLSNFVALIFTLAMVVFVFMILWGAFDWLMSEGDKEKISSAQKKIINAVIGIMLFALAFAIIRILGAVTGFTFFKAVNP